MANKVRVTVSINKSSVESVDLYSREYTISRSEALDRIIRQWKKQTMLKELRSGYLALREENLKTARENTELFKEVLDDIIGGTRATDESLSFLLLH